MLNCSRLGADNRAAAPLRQPLFKLARALHCCITSSLGKQGLRLWCCVVCLLGAGLCLDALVSPTQVPDLPVRPMQLAMLTERHSQL